MAGIVHRGRGRRWSLLLAALSFLHAHVVALAAPPQQSPGDPVAGAELASTWCAQCHVVDRGARVVSAMGAPAFQLIADDAAVSEMALRVILQTPHDVMPDVKLTPEQSDDVVAYITSLRHAGATH